MRYDEIIGEDADQLTKRLRIDAAREKRAAAGRRFQDAIQSANSAGDRAAEKKRAASSRYQAALSTANASEQRALATNIRKR